MAKTILQEDRGKPSITCSAHSQLIRSARHPESPHCLLVCRCVQSCRTGVLLLHNALSILLSPLVISFYKNVVIPLHLELIPREIHHVNTNTGKKVLWLLVEYTQLGKSKTISVSSNLTLPWLLSMQLKLNFMVCLKQEIYAWQQERLPALPYIV